MDSAAMAVYSLGHPEEMASWHMEGVSDSATGLEVLSEVTGCTSPCMQLGWCEGADW